MLIGAFYYYLAANLHLSCQDFQLTQHYTQSKTFTGEINRFSFARGEISNIVLAKELIKN
jgi:hypothetical protein